MAGRTLLLLLALALLSGLCHGLIKRCFVCRSRGELGSCKDPFVINGTQADTVRGVSAVPCASGWCTKILEGGNVYKDDDYGVATQRSCLQRSPPDNEERCAYTIYNYKKVYMCFCTGDLCNGGNSYFMNWNVLVLCFGGLFGLRNLII